MIRRLGFKPQHSLAAPAGPLSHDINSLCSRGATSWLPNKLGCAMKKISVLCVHVKGFLFFSTERHCAKNNDVIEIK